MEATVGADHDAELLAKVSKAEIEGCGQEGDDAKGGEVVHGVVLDVSVESFEGDKIGEKDVGQKGGKEEVEAVFEDASPDFWEFPGGFVEAFAGA